MLSLRVRNALFLRRTKRALEFVVFCLFDVLALMGFKQKSAKNLIVLVQTKLLGDYILWLPYARVVINRLQTQGEEVVLVLNAAVLPLANEHFPDLRIIGIERHHFVRSPTYRRKILRLLRSLSASWTVLDAYPRDAIIEDATVRALAAPENWGFDAIYVERSLVDRLINRRLYTRLLPPMPNIHQTRRHLAMAQAMGVAETEIIPVADLFKCLDAPIAQGEYVVVAPGASRLGKQWPISKFVDLMKCSDFEGFSVCVVGTDAERALGDEVVKVYPDRAKNYCGETSLLEFVSIVSRARLVVGNDSSAVHIAAACEVPALAIVGGGDFSEFFPYPENSHLTGRLPSVAYKSMPCFNCKWVCRWRVSPKEPYPCIASIEIEDAMKALRQRL